MAWVETEVASDEIWTPPPPLESFNESSLMPENLPGEYEVRVQVSSSNTTSLFADMVVECKNDLLVNHNNKDENYYNV